MFKKLITTVFLVLIISCYNIDSAHNKADLVIVSYNVQNLFDDIDNGREYKSYDPAGADWNSEKYRIKLENISEVINKINPQPDIIAFQEIENAGVLETLRKNYLSPEYKYSYATDFRGSAINLGIISSIKAEAVRTHDLVYYKKPLRGIQEAVFRINGGKLVVLNNHWKSKSGGAEKTEKVRISYSALLKSRLADLDSDNFNVVVLGDLNENHNEYERVSGKYLTALVPAIAGSEKNLQDSIVLGDLNNVSKAVLFSPWFESSSEGSYKYKGSWETIDHFILREDFFDNKGWEYKAFSVFKEDFLMTQKGYPRKWQNFSSSGYSDHLPIILELEFFE